MKKKIILLVSLILIFSLSFGSFSLAASQLGGNFTIEGLKKSFPLPLSSSFYPYEDSFDSIMSGIDYYGLGSSYVISDELDYFSFYNNGKLYILFYHPDYTSFSYSSSQYMITFNYTVSSWFFQQVEGKFYITNALVTVTKVGDSYNYSYSRTNTNSNIDLRLYYEASSDTLPTHDGGYYLHGYPCYISDFIPTIDIEGETFNLFEPHPDSIVDGDITVPDLPDDDVNQGFFHNLVLYLNQFLQKILSGLSSIKAAISDLLSNVTDWLSEIRNSIARLISEIGGYFSSLYQQLTHEFTGIRDFFQPFMDIVWELYQCGLDSNGNFDLFRMLSTVFLPDMDYFISSFQHFFNENFGWLAILQDILNLLFSTFSLSGTEVPSITIPAGSYGSFVLKNDVVWSFEWFVPYRPTVETLITAFVLVFFSWRMLSSLPNIISGVGSPFLIYEHRSGMAVKRQSSRKGG